MAPTVVTQVLSTRGAVSSAPRGLIIRQRLETFFGCPNWRREATGIALHLQLTEQSSTEQTDWPPNANNIQKLYFNGTGLVLGRLD